MRSSILSAIPYTFSVLLRQFLRLGWDTTLRFVLTITHWGTRRFWPHAFARRTFRPFDNLLMNLHLSLNEFLCFPMQDRYVSALKGAWKI
jgi:hypothetical protein